MQSTSRVVTKVKMRELGWQRCYILWPPPPVHGHSGTLTFLSEEDLFEMHLNPDNDKF
jgi:hypothetical protein